MSIAEDLRGDSVQPWKLLLVGAILALFLRFTAFDVDWPVGAWAVDRAQDLWGYVQDGREAQATTPPTETTITVEVGG